MISLCQRINYKESECFVESTFKVNKLNIGFYNLITKVLHCAASVPCRIITNVFLRFSGMIIWDYKFVFSVQMRFIREFVIGLLSGYLSFI